MTPGILDPERVAVIRGRVVNAARTPLAGVTIHVAEHGEYGTTTTPTDGVFSIAVNGGAFLTVRAEKSTYIPATRQAYVPWDEYVWVGDIVLLQYADPDPTPIDCSGTTTTAQIVGTTVVEDDFCERHTMVVVQPGTTCTVTGADGSTSNPSTLQMQLTEVTAGDQGPEAMPSTLPPQSAYTYAVDISSPEAVAAGAQGVQFSQPAAFYVTNCVGAGAGDPVPVGRDPGGGWTCEPNGVVVDVVRSDPNDPNSPPGFDVTGDGAADDPNTLGQFGITQAERERLATPPSGPPLVSVGDSFWRSGIRLWNPHDLNWAGYLNTQALTPKPRPLGRVDQRTEVCTGDQPLADLENKQAVSITGTPYRLEYGSSCVPGRTAERIIKVQVTGSTVNSSLDHVEVQLDVAGRHIETTLSPTANNIFEYVWDGRDGFGRIVHGPQRALVTVGYVYSVESYFYAVVEEFANYGKYQGNNSGLLSRMRQPFAVLHTLPAIDLMGVCDARWQGLGGWDIDKHLEPKSSLGGVLRTPYGVLSTPTYGLAIDSEGTVFFASGNQVIALYRDQTYEVVVNSGGHATDTLHPLGDDGDAKQATLNQPLGVALGPDGSLYIADQRNSRVRRVVPPNAQGVRLITTAAGNGVDDHTGDGGLATDASMHWPGAIAVAPDGSIYFGERNGNTRSYIRRVSPCGTIWTVGGGGNSNANDVPALQADIYSIMDLELGPDGSLYFSEFGGYRVRRMTPSGLVSTVAGGHGWDGNHADGIPALDASVGFPHGLAVDQDGTLYIIEKQITAGSAARIRKVTPDGIISTVAGTGKNGNAPPLYIVDGALATHADLTGLYDTELSPSGDLYFSARAIRYVEGPPRFRDAENLEPQPDGTVAVFSQTGRHLRTLDKLTGAPRYLFGYDSVGRLTSVTEVTGFDGNGQPIGNVTTIEHDGSGEPSAIVGPFGQRTVLNVDTNGYLNSIANPNGDEHLFTYATTGSGLMTSMAEPNDANSLYTFSYDDAGRLSQVIDPAGGSVTYARTEPDINTFAVTATSEEGQVTTLTSTRSSDGTEQSVTTNPDGTQSTVTTSADLKCSVTLTTGTAFELTNDADPRFGNVDPQLTKLVYVDGSIQGELTEEQEVTLADPSNPMSLLAQTRVRKLSSTTLTSVHYEGSNKTIVSTSGMGRVKTQTLDSLGREIQSETDGLNPTARQYDAAGRPSMIIEGPNPSDPNDPDNRVTRLGYKCTLSSCTPSDSNPNNDNENGLLDTVEDAIGRTVHFDYDDAGRITKGTLPDGREITVTYDANGNVTSISPPGRSAHVFEYTPMNQEALYDPPQVTPALTVKRTIYTYDDDQRLETMTRPDGGVVTYHYDVNNKSQLTSKELPTGQGTVTYDYYPANAANPTSGAGLVQYIHAPDDGTLSYAYDGSLPVSEGWDGSNNGMPSGSVERGYDNRGWLHYESVNGANTVEYIRDLDGLLTDIGPMTLDPNGSSGLLDGTVLGDVADGYIRNEFGEVVEYTASVGMPLVMSVSYVRDKVGRIEKKTEMLDGDLGSTDTFYKYDQAGRLYRVCDDDSCTSIRAEYEYDLNSNRTGGFTSSGTIEADYDEQDRLLSYSTTSGSVTTTTTYTYTANGELETKTKTTAGATTGFSYDALGNLRHVDLPNGDDIDYVIDGKDRRIGKKVNGTLAQAFLYEDQLRPVAEINASGTVVSRFIYGDKVNVPEFMLKGGETYRILTDHLGSPRLVIKTDDGTIAQRIDYDEWGVVLADTNPGFQPFGFAGGIWDADTGLVRFGARDYDARTGRWTSKDPIRFEGNDVLLFGYCWADPVNRSDAIGKGVFIEQIIIGGIGWAAAYANLKLVPKCNPGFLGGLAGALAGSAVLGVAAVGIGPVALGAWSAAQLGYISGIVGASTAITVGCALL